MNTSENPNLKTFSKVGKGSPVNINWELVSHCQFKCTYCYYKPFESKTDYIPLSKIIIKKISTIKDPTKVTLLGGEPSLHPIFHEIVKELHALPHVISIPVVTNFEKPLDFWMQLLPYKDKVKIVISFHAEYSQEDAFTKIELLQKLFTLDLVFIVHDKLKFLPHMLKDAEKVKSLSPDVTINYIRIHDKDDQQDRYRKYPEEIENFINYQNKQLALNGKSELVNIFTDNTWTKVPKFELIQNNLNNFRDWSCKLRAFTIHHDGMVSSACSAKTKKHILVENFKETLMKCTFNICECDDYWEFPKEKN